MKHLPSLTRAAACLLLLPCAAAMASAPVAISPGGLTRTARVEARCPTFSWIPVAQSDGLELVVYGLEESGELAPRPALTRVLPPAAASWTPTLEDCLERGGRYAWLLRARTSQGEEVLSSPRLFEIAGQPSEEELARALEVVHRYLEGERTPPAGAALPRDGRSSADAPTSSTASTPRPGNRAPLPLALGNGPLGLSVEVSDAVDTAAAIVGIASGASGDTLGVVGIADSPTGAGVLGFANADTGTDAAGVVGEAAATSGGATGVYGRTFSPSGVGVRAANFAGGVDLLLDGASPTLLTESAIEVGGSTFEIGNAADDLALTLDGKPVVATTATCSTGEIPKLTGGLWTCSPDANSDTLATLACSNDQVAKWTGTAWACAADADTDTDTDTLAGLSCASGEIAKWSGSTWECQADASVGGADGPCTGSFTDSTQRFVDCGNGTVTDTATGLIWLRDASCATLSGLSAEAEGSWSQVQQAVAALDDGECGLTDGSRPGDWRLPTRSEWQLMLARADELACTFPNAAVVDTMGTGCWSEGDPFTGVQTPTVSNGYFSDTVLDTDPSSVYAFLSYGQMTPVLKNATDYAAWPVRGSREVDPIRLILAYDGPGSGLNADKLDGVNGTDLATDTEVFSLVLAADGPGSGLDADTVDGIQGVDLAQKSEVFPLVLASDGAGSGLNADQLDGIDSLAFATHTALSTSGTAAVHWNNLVSVPAGFADGVDSGVDAKIAPYIGAPVPITTQYPVFTVVQTVMVPAGSWVLFGGLNLTLTDVVESGVIVHPAGTYCQLAVGTSHLDFVVEAAPRSFCSGSLCAPLRWTAGARSTITLVGAITFAAETEVRLECAQTDPGAGASVTADGRSLIAAKVQSVSSF
jgi:Protein of unknown function (DUF1566)